MTSVIAEVEAVNRSKEDAYLKLVYSCDFLNTSVETNNGTTVVKIAQQYREIAGYDCRLMTDGKKYGQKKQDANFNTSNSTSRNHVS